MINRILCTLIFSTIAFTAFTANEDILKKIVLTKSNGKVTALNPEKIIGIKRINVNAQKNWSTTVLELNNKGEIFISKYKNTAVQIAKKSEDVGVKFRKIHDGQYYNPMHYKYADAFITDGSIYVNPNKLNHQTMKSINSNTISVGKRTGKIFFNGKTIFDVSKRTLPKIKLSFLLHKFKRKLLKSKRMLTVAFTALLLDNIYCIECIENQFKSQKAKLLKQLHLEYNEVLCLEGDESIDLLVFWGLAQFPYSVRDSRYSESVQNKILFEKQRETPLKNSIIYLADRIISLDLNKYLDSNQDDELLSTIVGWSFVLFALLLTSLSINFIVEWFTQWSIKHL